jgi:hypothetical protein
MKLGLDEREYVPLPEYEAAAREAGRRFDPAPRVKAARPVIAFRGIAQFCAEYVPLAYTIEGILRAGSLYTLTGKTGSGKTAFNVIAALAVATGRADILGREMHQGRVAYLAFENPDDIRMRFKIAAFILGVDLARIAERILILDLRFKPDVIRGELARLAEAEPFALVNVDTLAAFFDGKDINDNVQGGDFMRSLRPLTQIKGLPAVLVSAHPVKSANCPEMLVPYGGGAILNEVDGNLTLWKEAEGGVTLHWTGKLRGPDFAPVPLYFDQSTSPDIVDVKGRQVELPTLRPTSEQAAQQRKQDDADIDRALLAAMLAEPAGTQQSWAEAIGRAKGRVNAKLQKLKAESFVADYLGKWTVTPKGRKALEIVKGRAEQE